MRIAIRLSIPWAENLIAFFSRFEYAVVYQHDADEEVKRTHIHALVELDTSTDTLKNRLEALLGYRLPKTDWAFSTKVGKPKSPVNDNFITYMSKGHLKPLYLKGFTEDECEKYKTLWIEKPQRSDVVKKQVSGFQLSQELAEWVNQETGTNKWVFLDGRFICDNPNQVEITETDIIHKCINLHNKYEKSYCDFSLARCIQTAYGLSEKGHWKEYLVQSVKQKLALRI